MQHGLITFARHPTNHERSGLEQIGIRVLTPLLGATYRVRVRKDLDVQAFMDSPLRPQLVRLQPKDRVDPILWGNDFARYDPATYGEKGPNWVLSPDGRFLNVMVRMYGGLTHTEMLTVLRKYDQQPEKQSDTLWRLTMERSALNALSEEDLAEWIDAGPGAFPARFNAGQAAPGDEFRPDNDKTRKAVGIEILQDFCTWQEGGELKGRARGLAGRGVQVGLFDKGIARHKDYEGRILDDPRSEFHATHLAGIIAGNGTMSDRLDSNGKVTPGAAPFKWRGMAPEAQLLDIYQDPPHGRNGANAETHLRYIKQSGMDLSNHSYQINFHDNSYDNSNRMRDEIIRGDATSNGTPVPARLHVTSAGNQGHERYFTLDKQLKNALVVGAWQVSAWEILPKSSRGPTGDGRIKPDVVAPGWIMSTSYCAPGDRELRNPQQNFLACDAGRERTNFYDLYPGTSQAAAATAGALALVLEQYAKTYKVNLDDAPPLPSTLRALMVHTARNKPPRPAPSATASCDARARNGPEERRHETEAMRRPNFETGWGLIDVQAAARSVSERRLLEDRIANTCEAITYAFDVPLGTKGPVRVTLAWDDAAGDPALSDSAPKLVNDLDLVLIDPKKIRRYPWQLDQGIARASAGGKPRCGVAAAVHRELTPDTGLKGSDGNAARAKAVRGPDHLNNIEVVDAPAFAGRWYVEVLGFNIPQGPQTFTLTGARFTRHHVARRAGLAAADP